LMIHSEYKRYDRPSPGGGEVEGWAARI